LLGEQAPSRAAATGAASDGSGDSRQAARPHLHPPDRRYPIGTVDTEEAKAMSILWIVLIVVLVLVLLGFFGRGRF
jgi:hypothetical protein